MIAGIHVPYASPDQAVGLQLRGQPGEHLLARLVTLQQVTEMRQGGRVRYLQSCGRSRSA